MKHSMILVFTSLFIGVSASGQDFTNPQIQVPDAFNLLQPEKGAHIVLTNPAQTFTLQWEDVLGLDDNNDQDPENPERYYLLRPGLDPNLEIDFEDDILLQASLTVPASDLGFVFRFIESVLGTKVDTVTIYWTAAAVNEEGTTWANDTFYVSFEIDNDLPSRDFVLLEPEQDAVVEVLVSGETHIPVESHITFSWSPSTDPDDDTVYYFCVMSDVFPLPDVLGFFEGDNGNNDHQNIDVLSMRQRLSAGSLGRRSTIEQEPMLLIFPSGVFDFEMEWDLGGIDTFLKLPNEIAHYWILGEQDEKIMYWTVLASDGFGVYHWVPGEDTLRVTFRRILTSIGDHSPGNPTEYYLGQNYPNPFNPSTTIRYTLPERGFVRLTIYNAIGQEVLRLVDAEVDAGTHLAILDASSLPSGVYVYRLQAGDYVGHKKLTVLK
jgi:hypothetical protein